MARRFYGVFIVFLLKLALGECEESNEEVAPYYEVLGNEYEQIYQGIPTLFEYLIEILEERPEILEKDDTAFFQPPQEACDENKNKKRDTYEQCNSNQDSAEDIVPLGRNIAINNADDVKHTNPDSDHATNEVITEISEFKITESRNNNNKLESKFNDKTKTTKMGKKYKGKNKKRDVNRDESFLGSIDWNKLYLSPEEVEEQALKVEQAIEDHNEKKER